MVIYHSLCEACSKVYIGQLGRRTLEDTTARTQVAQSAVATSASVVSSLTIIRVYLYVLLVAKSSSYCLLMFAHISPKHYTSMLESTMDGLVHILAGQMFLGASAINGLLFILITISFYHCEVSQLFMYCAILLGQVKLLNLAMNCCHCSV